MPAAAQPIIPPPAERRRRNREAMITAILDAARAVMREEGVAALNLNELARRLGMRTPSLYEYFPSKMALYDALFIMGMRLFRERVERLLAEHSGGWAGLHAALENHMAFAQEYPEFYYLCFERPVPGFVPSTEGLRESQVLLTVSQQAMAQAIERGEIAPGVPAEQAHDLFLALMHGLTALQMANEPEQPVGSGRFGSLTPAAIGLLRAAWEPRRAAHAADDSPKPSI